MKLLLRCETADRLNDFLLVIPTVDYLSYLTVVCTVPVVSQPASTSSAFIAHNLIDIVIEKQGRMVSLSVPLPILDDDISHRCDDWTDGR